MLILQFKAASHYNHRLKSFGDRKGDFIIFLVQFAQRKLP